MSNTKEVSQMNEIQLSILKHYAVKKFSFQMTEAVVGLAKRAAAELKRK